MKILISGSTGFIGEKLVNYLLTQNHTLHVIIRPSTVKRSFDRRVKVYEFNGNTADLVTFMQSERFDGVIHLASLFLASHTPENVTELIQSNVLFGSQLLEASVKSETSWFINTGTFVQHYKNKKYSPANLYAATKQAFESIATYYIETSKINFVTITLFDTFGPGDTRPKIFNLLSKISATGENLAMSPGEQVIDTSYIDNVIDGYAHMISLLSNKSGSKLRGKSYALYAEKRVTLKELVKIFEQITKKQLNITWGGRGYRPREVMIPWDKGLPIPNFKPRFSLEEGIKQTLKANQM